MGARSHPDFSRRTSHAQLPAGNEIMHISAAEEKRALLPERVDIHFPDFSGILEVYSHYNLDPSIFTQENLTADYILDTGAKQVEELVGVIMKKDLSRPELSLLKNLYSYLSEADKAREADNIFVFGAKTPITHSKSNRTL